MPTPTLYFAYGSNMNERQLRSRVPGARKVGTGHLLGHEFLFSGYSQTWRGSVANVKPCRGSQVFGVLYELPPGGLAELDRFEGYPRAYQRKTTSIARIPRGRARAILYYKRDTRPLGPPSPEYVAVIGRALKEHRAP